MKLIKEIALQYGIDWADFERFVRKQDLDYTESISGIAISDSKANKYVEMYKKSKLNQLSAEEEARRAAEEAQRAAEAAQRAAEEAAKKQKALAEMLITSGFNFDGYKVVKYSGYISGDDATQIPRGGIFGQNNGENLTNALVKIRRQALIELKEAAYDLGCNAVIGVDFDYITLEPESVNITGGTRYEPYVICVTANGNAVVIEKES